MTKTISKLSRIANAALVLQFNNEIARAASVSVAACWRCFSDSALITPGPSRNSTRFSRRCRSRSGVALGLCCPQQSRLPLIFPSEKMRFGKIFCGFAATQSSCMIRGGCGLFGSRSPRVVLCLECAVVGRGGQMFCSCASHARARLDGRLFLVESGRTRHCTVGRGNNLSKFAEGAAEHFASQRQHPFDGSADL